MSKIMVEIKLEFTPNPNTLKYALNRQITCNRNRKLYIERGG